LANDFQLWQCNDVHLFNKFTQMTAGAFVAILQRPSDDCLSDKNLMFYMNEIESEPDGKYSYIFCL
jgi:hypothetical protein